MSGAGRLGEAASAPIHTEVLVIGGGIAGAIAALAARREGRAVALVRKAYGATALSSGAADLAPDPLATPGQPLGARSSLLECAKALARLSPQHPYAVLYESLPRLGEALGFASEALGGALCFAELADENRVFLSQLGVLKTSAGGLRGQFEGDLLRAKGPVGVVGFRGHPEWDAERWVDGVAEVLREAGLACQLLPLASDFLGGLDPALRPHQIAARIAAAPERLVASLRRALPAGGPQPARFLFPPLLDGAGPSAALDALSLALGVPCGELPALRLSLPGLRLQELLDRSLLEAGVTLRHGEAFATRDGDLESLRIRDAAPKPPPRSHFDPAAPSGDHQLPSWELRARAVVLATGRFIGGGVQHHERLLEPIFNLPIWVGGKVDLGTWTGALSRHELRDEQPLFAAGLRTDPALRPRNSRGQINSERLFACGDLLSGNDPARDGAGLGLACFTGYLAGLGASHAAERA